MVRQLEMPIWQFKWQWNRKWLWEEYVNTLIADAKYKPLNNISGKDYLQVLAYMFRFDAKQGFYLYPEAKGADSQSFRLNRGVTYEGKIYPREDIKVTKCGINIPQGTADYADFIIQMQQEEQLFK